MPQTWGTRICEPNADEDHFKVCDGTKEADHNDAKYVTAAISVRDLFSFNLQSPTVMLIACGSGKQEIKPGDEPMGLISAFLYAGATSVIGTLWPTLSEDGRTFAEIIYERIAKMDRNHDDFNGDRLIDLAVAVQHATLEVRRMHDFDQVYHWAGFVLHGFWNIPCFTSWGEY